MKKKDNSKAAVMVLIVFCVIVIPVFIGIVFGIRPSSHTPYWAKDLPAELADKVDSCHKKGMKAGRLTKGGDVVDIKCYEE